MILLTEEDIEKSVGDSWEAFPMSICHIVAKAQAKKIFREIEASFSQDSTNREYLISFDKWQELKQEAQSE